MLPKKHFGQNFLTSPAAVERILVAANISPGDVVLEIGPGKGMITRRILERGAHVIAVEKDAELVSFLKEAFQKAIESGKLEIVHGDFLDFNPHEHALAGGEWKLVGAIPYYITGRIFRSVFSGMSKPKTAALIVQKEIAERIARSKKESLLSLSVKAYGAPKYIATIKAGSFFPKPKVDSAVLLVENISTDFFKKYSCREDVFFWLLRMGFSGKRKKLLTNLKKDPALGVGLSRGALAESGISPDLRAEDVALQGWGALCRALCRKEE